MRVGRLDTLLLLVGVSTLTWPTRDHGPNRCILGRLFLLPGGARPAPSCDSLEDWTQSTMGVGSGSVPPPPAPLGAGAAAGVVHCVRAGAPWVGFVLSQMPRYHALGDIPSPIV